MISPRELKWGAIVRAGMSSHENRMMGWYGLGRASGTCDVQSVFSYEIYLIAYIPWGMYC